MTDHFSLFTCHTMGIRRVFFLVMDFMRNEHANISHCSHLFLSSSHKKLYSRRKQVILIVDNDILTTPEPAVKVMHIKIQSEYPN